MNRPLWIIIHPKMTLEHLGFLPSFLDEEDPRSAKEQIDANYQHGGGWRTIPEFIAIIEDYLPAIQYPGDPVLQPLAATSLRGEVIAFYDGAFVGIFQPDGSFEVARID